MAARLVTVRGVPGIAVAHPFHTENPRVRALGQKLVDATKDDPAERFAPCEEQVNVTDLRVFSFIKKLVKRGDLKLCNADPRTQAAMGAKPAAAAPEPAPGPYSESSPNDSRKARKGGDQ